MNDLKFDIRQLLNNPGFTAVAVLTPAYRARKLSRRASFEAFGSKLQNVSQFRISADVMWIKSYVRKPCFAV